MHRSSITILFSLILIAAIAFLLFTIPNSRASDDLAMVSIFEPDEGIAIPVVFRMISPKETFKQFIIQFVFYEYYFYGFPYFASSALVLFPLQWLDHLQNMPLVMLTLRQMISVLPMLAGLLILVFMQDGFQTYRSIGLFIFLLFVPAIVRNGFWWHPDGLTLLLSVLVIYFLWKDNRQFGWKFVIAAAICGVLIATKLVGAYFFLAVGTTLIWGLFEKKLTWKKALRISLIFILIMVIFFILANPFILSKGTRIWYFDIVKKQSAMLSQGYGIVYEKGLHGAWPLMHEFYGEVIFLILAIGATLWGIWQSKNRFLHALTLAWFIPLTISLLTTSHFKFQYWLPVAIPLFSNLIVLLPETWKELKWTRIQWIIRGILLAIVGVQFVMFFSQSVQMAAAQIQRKENNPHIDFYDQSLEQLSPIFPDEMYVYYDYRLYVPETTGWVTETSFELLDYDYIQGRNFQILLLLEQRIRDYLHPNATGIDAEQFALNQQFYRDADNGNIEGYHLLYRNETGLIYIHDDVCQAYFDPFQCQ